jgi:LPS-assembly lipoprotein
MLLFDLSSGRSRTAAALLLLAIPFIAGGCQVRPLYAVDSQAETALKSIEFSDAEDRVGQRVRNELIFLTSGGAGEPSDPAYDVDLKVKTRNIGVLLEMSSDTPRAGRIEVKADFTLKKRATGEALKTGHRTAVALVDFPTQEFARIRAIRDAENRAARELAELIRADLASWLGR